MKVYLIPNMTKAETAGVALKTAEVLCCAGIEVLVGTELAYISIPNSKDGKPFWRVMPDANAAAECDVVVTIGGDGTMLHAARQTILTQKPLLGINMGRLGFLTAVELDELHKLRRLSAGEYTVEHRSVLQAEFLNSERTTYLALNDIVLFKQTAEKTISMEIYCDETLISRFRGDGVVFATPTGSTAYSLSAGGPILDARLAGIVVTQICAHIVQTPPVVLAGDRVLQVKFKGPEDEKMLVSCDGMRCGELVVGDTIVIKQALQTVPLIQFADADQLKSIDKKLKGR